ncbi:DUF2156 domain-containing protein [Candidatus Galacturonibacter soehngenii]|uniref:DUF2156 domain-containing protein n=1 Tax=Candidatus Galacturonatibacter soehngenii TaxID=2307010 RepID=A0A7V7QK46_9FIRM|nr:phosphatidylglycerol lysyltransferase domain-containing protein [Candidatus Galacturonibacter soehngenii]KAB1438115.1 DUF2156 domain-containing protein [Candidatus Galacturonibacter soehngenii]
MMKLEFRQVKLEDKELIDSYIKKQNSKSCSISFANIYLWEPHYKVTFTIVENMLVFRSNGEKPYFSFPIGGGDVKKAIDFMMEYCKEMNLEFKMYGVTQEQFHVIEELYPGEFQVEYNRDEANYVYETEKLINLSGKKYHGKKNHINKFKRLYPDWQYEDITDENLEECIEMAYGWRKENDCDTNELKRVEFCVSLNALKKLKELELIGGLIRAEGKVVAITVGEPLTNDTFVIHIEKAYAGVEGAYPMINREFLAHHATDYMYVNREEDTGAEGLRKAKLSYKPVFMVESGYVTKIK